MDPAGPEGPGQPGGYDEQLAEITGQWAERFVAFDQELDAHHLTGAAHHHLAILAVRPDLQGHGIGTALLDAHHAILDEGGIVAYLEASDEGTRGIYLRHGYADYGSPIELADGPFMYPMVRHPRAPGTSAMTGTSGCEPGHPQPGEAAARRRTGKNAPQHPGMAVSDDRVFAWGEAEKDLTPGIDTTVPTSARVWNYWLGGKDGYPVDRRAGDASRPAVSRHFRPGPLVPVLPARLIRFLAAEAGIRQFLDIGAGLPFQDSTHEIAEAAAPGCHVVYADNDPMVMAYARALNARPPGSTDHIHADLNDPGALLDKARASLDFTRPVAVLLMQVLGHIGDPRDGDHTALAAVGQIKDALPSGGCLAISEIADTEPALNAALGEYRQTGADPYHARRPDQIARFSTAWNSPLLA